MNYATFRYDGIIQQKQKSCQWAVKLWAVKLVRHHALKNKKPATPLSANEAKVKLAGGSIIKTFHGRFLPPRLQFEVFLLPLCRCALLGRNLVLTRFARAENSAEHILHQI